MGKSRTFFGCLFAAEVNEAGVVQGNWEHLGEAYPLSTLVNKEVITIPGRTCRTNGLNIDSKEKPSGASGDLTLRDYTAGNVARATGGSVSQNSVSESTLTAEAVTLGKFNEWVEIGTEDLATGETVQDSTDTTTYVEDVDYHINRKLGLITPIEGGAIAEDAEVHISGTGQANTANVVTIGGASTKKYALKGSLIDDFTGDEGKFYLRKVRLVSKSGVVTLSDPDTDRELLEFELIPEIPTGLSDYGTFEGLPL